MNWLRATCPLAGMPMPATSVRNTGASKAKLGPDHPDTLVSMNNLARSYSDFGRYAEAVKLDERLSPLRRSSLDPTTPRR